MNIYINNNDIESQINAVTMTLERDLRYMMYISIDETFIVYTVKLQSLIMMINIINVMKMIKSEL